MDKIKIFTFGYWGWGSSIKELDRAIAEVEVSRNFTKPLYIDLRYSRAVRAVGFKGDAFRDAVGSARYRWMKSLGNGAIGKKLGPRIEIDDPEAVEELLGIALESDS
ncbi:hypothetical protein [Tardiphaga sp. vice278]|uniref:hypothetical protein n=1 Tax=Tardiphaga sp. vice278 TaxID=2592815 RepID=UPI00116499A1|nr:hypothetical protein [Tardiphaga sp. vice278]QDM18181.1 hypothetical protein FNL53_21270 [Tardiphaga sp. vice278]